MVRTFEHSGETRPPGDSRPSADASQPAGAEPAPKDRRRPGRKGDVNPTLLPLLRRDHLLERTARQQEEDDLAPARGIAISVLIGAVLWSGIASLIYWLLAS